MTARILHKCNPTLRLLVGAFVGTVFGSCLTWGVHMRLAQHHAIEESKLCHLALTQNADKLTSQTREYLKARYYWNAAVHITPSSLAGWQTDFGPVDDSVLSGIKPYKDASTSFDVLPESARQASPFQHLTMIAP